MDLTTFESSLVHPLPNSNWSAALQAIWWDRKGDWSRAHDLAQDDHSDEGSWIHAYLHRKEGDLGNAGYWYRIAGRPRFEGTLDDEWESIACELLKSV